MNIYGTYPKNIDPSSKFNKKDAHNILYSSISASPIVRIPAGTAVWRGSWG